MTATKIIDIRTDTVEADLLSNIKNGLRHDGEKKLPTLLLYNQDGLRLFEKITYLEEYYLTNAEIEVLEMYSTQIAGRIPAGSVIVELGSGNLRKVNLLLQAIDRLGKDTEYYALDISLPELERTFAQIPLEGYRHVKCFGLYGTYDNALEWFRSSDVKSKPKTVLWLGSSLGNFKRHEVPSFLSGFAKFMQAGDTMLIGIDSCKEPERVYHAYNDREGITHQFILNGLKHANEVMGEQAFHLDDWEVIGEFDSDAGRHQAFVSPCKDVVVDGVAIPQGQRIRIEESYKYSREEAKAIWEGAQLVENTVWASSRGDYGLHLVSKPFVFFPLQPEQYASRPVPSLVEWQGLWKAWDAITKKMIPQEELMSKPIKLRNECIFYLGHIPTFLDIHLTRATDVQATEPADFWKIFERGIDPDVEDPSKCHVHSEIPAEWPVLDVVLQYQEKVRARVTAIYRSGEAEKNACISEALWLGFEHEAMHAETLLYMLIQSDKVLPPPGTVTPDFVALAKQSETLSVENEWFTIPESSLQLGLDNDDIDSQANNYFGWDNEKPRRSTLVKSFRAKARPISNGEYAIYLDKTGQNDIPASWCEKLTPSNDAVDNVLNEHNTETNGSNNRKVRERYVRTVYGNVPLRYAMSWPVVASYDELARCAQWMGGRIPTMDEARSIYHYVNRMKMEFQQSFGSKTPAVNGHLINNGVDETPPSRPESNGHSSTSTGPNPQDTFIDLGGTNVGFKHWHPVSVVERGGKLCGQSDLGGVWEWTSSVLEKHDGFVPMEIYPGYTADFFDGKHNIVLGGSWATHPRIAGRKTFINWYQRNYPYVWAGARIVTNI